MFKKITILIIVCFTINACTLSRTLIHNKPSIKDGKHFSKVILSKAVKASQPFIQQPNSPLPPVKQWTRHQRLKSNQSLETYLKKTNTTDFIVLRNDTNLYENYFNGNDANSQDIGFSITKTFITSLLAIAIEEGHIKGVNQKIGDFIPSYATGKRKNMTINDVLQMTSGLNYGDYSKKMWQLAKTYYTPKLKDLVDEADLAHEPNTHFAYKSIDTQILGFCIENAVGKTISEYLNEKIWQPLGMENDALFTLDQKNGNERMYGGLGIGSRDLMRFAKLYLNKGKWNGQQIIPEKWVTSIYHRNMSEITTPNAKWWGYNKGWWLETYLNGNLNEQKDFYAAGYNGQLLYINPEANVIILRRGHNKGGVNWQIALGNLAELLHTGDNYQLEEEVVAKNNLIQQHIFEGKYRKKGGKKLVQLKRKANEWLFETDNGKTCTPLARHCPQSLYSDSKFTRIIFQIENNQVVGLYVDDFQNLTYFEKIE